MIFIGENKKTSIRIISVIKVVKYLRKGYEAYLASVVEERKESIKLKEL